MPVDNTASLGNLFWYLTFLAMQMFSLYLIRISLCTMTTGSRSFAASLWVQLSLCCCRLQLYLSLPVPFLGKRVLSAFSCTSCAPVLWTRSGMLYGGTQNWTEGWRRGLRSTKEGNNPCPQAAGCAVAGTSWLGFVTGRVHCWLMFNSSTGLPVSCSAAGILTKTSNRE